LIQGCTEAVRPSFLYSKLQNCKLNLHQPLPSQGGICYSLLKNLQGAGFCDKADSVRFLEIIWRSNWKGVDMEHDIEKMTQDEITAFLETRRPDMEIQVLTLGRSHSFTIVGMDFKPCPVKHELVEVRVTEPKCRIFRDAGVATGCQWQAEFNGVMGPIVRVSALGS